METSFCPNRANGWGKAFLTQKSFQKDVLSPLSITWTLFCNICPRAFRLLKESTLWLKWGAIFSIDKVPPKGVSPKLVSPYPFCQKTLVPFLAPFTSREFNLSPINRVNTSLIIMSIPEEVPKKLLNLINHLRRNLKYRGKMWNDC